MTVETRVHGALELVDEEREALDRKRTAVDRFVREVDALSPAPANEPPMIADRAGDAAAAATTIQHGRPAVDRCRDVRELFAETIRPHSVDDVDRPEPLLRTIAEELGRELAVALSSQTDRRFTPEVKAAVQSAARQRSAEIEAPSLRAAVSVIDDVTDWIGAADETPLSSLDFDELRDRHETLAAYRDRCRRLCRERQETLNGRTRYTATAGLSHRTLVSYLYQGYPVLWTALRLEEVCATCQRSVRDHLVRRV